jgi:hypothetical protein
MIINQYLLSRRYKRIPRKKKLLEFRDCRNMRRKLNARRNCCYNNHNSDVKYLRSASQEKFEPKSTQLSEPFK